MKTRIFLTFFLALIFLLNTNSYSCTTFCINTGDELVFGRNYDFNIGYGLIIANKRDVQKSAFVVSGTPLKWISKYGSITFNQFGREFPTGGINEKGLVVELMWLTDAKYSPKDDRPATGGVLQWIQYQLDNCETIQEVIDTDKDIRIPTTSVPLHFLITDKYGNSATIEFLDGKLVAHQGEKLPHRVLTNDTYEKSVDFFTNYKNGGNQTAYKDNSLDRFAKACSLVEIYNKEKDKNAVEYGFRILDDVKQGDHTKWTIVYDIKNMKIYFKTYDNSKLKNIDIGSVDFNCTTPVMTADINVDIEGNINGAMIDYTYEMNRKLIEESYNGVDFLQGVSAKEKDITAKYPSDFTCRSKSEFQVDENIKNYTDTGNAAHKIIYGLSLFLIVTFIFTGYRIKKVRQNKP